MERTLTGINLHEISVVTGFPAYPQTTAAVLSLEGIAERTGMSVDDLTDVLDALAASEQVDADKVQAIQSLIDSATPKVEPVNLIGLKQKQVDLLAKRW
jgi:predicted HAD superfamily Cof-like phosphohydrolase